MVTASWPIDTEMKGRLIAHGTAALASSIYIVARKGERKSIGFYNEVKKELKNYLNNKLDRLWDEGISGADFFIAGIGSAIEVFGKYERVITIDGKEVKVDKLLEDVREMVTEYAVRKILHNGFSQEISDLTRFYVLYRWEYGEARVEFDEARKLALSCGIDLEKEWSKNKNGFIKREKEYVEVLGPDKRKIEDLAESNEMIDVLHHVLKLWEAGRRDEMQNRLNRSGYLKSEVFYRVAQAISEVLPLESREKKLLDGFLSGKERIMRGSSQENDRQMGFDL